MSRRGAAQAEAAAAPKSRAPSPLLQRKCACGGASAMQTHCEECDKKRLSVQRRPAAGKSAPAAVPSVVHDVLRAPGRPLDARTRAFMESRFGHDFSKVRIHTGAEAAQSAVAVNARAYTVGRNVVFGGGEYSPHSAGGRRLLAHELAHTIQQGERAAPAPGDLKVGPPDDAHEREADDVADSVLSSAGRAPTSLSAGHVARTVLQRQQADDDDDASVQDEPSMPMIWFRLNSTELRADSEADSRIHFQHALRIIRDRFAVAGSAAHVTIYGYASVEGEEAHNQNLSRQRADRIKEMLVAEGIPAGQITAVGMGEDNSLPTLAWNRRVEIELTPHVTTIDMPEEHVTAEVPRFVCGPDVTAQISAAVSGIRTTFGGWTSTQKEEACDALDSIRHGGYAWDIVELHNNNWIHRNYRPPCATQGATPPCGSSVQVGSDCHYAGSPNYVIFGVMCKLCYDYYYSIMLVNTGLARFTSDAMLHLIDIYKGTGITGLGTPTGNFRESQAWALAGYRGWPSSASPPGDRSNCRPVCPTPYTGPSFRVNWYPHQFYTGSGR